MTGSGARILPLYRSLSANYSSPTWNIVVVGYCTPTVNCNRIHWDQSRGTTLLLPVNCTVVGLSISQEGTKSAIPNAREGQNEERQDQSSTDYRGKRSGSSSREDDEQGASEAKSYVVVRITHPKQKALKVKTLLEKRGKEDCSGRRSVRRTA
ncbi:unnamed protein product [Calypogeia fissa]